MKMNIRIIQQYCHVIAQMIISKFPLYVAHSSSIIILLIRCTYSLCSGVWLSVKIVLSYIVRYPFLPLFDVGQTIFSYPLVASGYFLQTWPIQDKFHLIDNNPCYIQYNWLYNEPRELALTKHWWRHWICLTH